MDSPPQNASLNEATDSNEDLSDEGLDISQRLCSDRDLGSESVEDANIKLQATVDRILSMLEETSKQLAESHSVQSQLADKLLESQKDMDDLRRQLEQSQSEHEEKIGELTSQLRNCDGLSEAYEQDTQRNKMCIAQLEHALDCANQELREARSQIESEKIVVSNLETVRKDLQEQRSFFTNDLQDVDIKSKSYIFVVFL